MAQEDFELREVDAPMVGTPLEHACDQFPFCPPEATRYRNIAGNCNNPAPNRGAWGAAGSPMYVLFYYSMLKKQYFRFPKKKKTKNKKIN